jgi:hypothetical protein
MKNCFSTRRRFATVARCCRGVAVPPATSRGVGYATECCKGRRIGLSGLPDPALASSLPIRLRGLPAVPVCRTLSRSAHPLVRFASPSESLEPLPARRCCPGSFPGLSSLIAASSGGVHRRGLPKPTPFRPRRFSRPRRLAPPPDFAGLFRPAATSRVRSSGVSPDEKPHGLVARRCPRVVARCRARLQGLAPLIHPSRRAVV